MAQAPIQIKLRCASWQQLSAIYKRDLQRSAVFLKSANPPPLGTQVQINLSLPTDSVVMLNGTVSAMVPPGGLGGRGPGIDIALHTIPQSAMWLIESALTSHKPRDEGSGAAGKPAAAARPTAAQAAPPAGAIDLGEDIDEEQSAEDGTDLVAAETELVAALQQELDSLKKLNPFQVLGVGYSANDDEVRAAFGGLTKRYHPDRYARFQSGAAKQVAAEIFILIRDAYRRLGDEKSRAATLQAVQQRRGEPGQQRNRIATAPAAPPPPPGPGVPATTMQIPVAPPPSGTAPPPSPAIPPIPPPPGTPRRASTQAVSVVPPPARPAAGPSAAAPPPRADANSEPGYIDIDLGEDDGPPLTLASEAGPAPKSLAPRGEYAAAEGLIEAGKYDEAIAIYKINVRRSPNDRVARAGIELAEGLRALAQRDRLEAAQRFEVVLELDPANERAARELADMRRQATNERKGLLSRLLGKKE